MGLQYSIVGSEDGQYVTVFVRGKTPLSAHESHPNFSRIIEKVLASDESVIDLFDVAKTVSEKFEALSDRVSIANSRLYLDNDEVHNSLAKQVLRFVDEGVEDWKPLVKFFENVQNNPNEHSRDELYDWLDKNDFQITEDGMIVAYKGVSTDRRSIRSGKAIVNGEVFEGQIPNPDGAIVEMPRSEVVHDPTYACHTGLHVANKRFAKSFGPLLLEVLVNPRDVVSVPDRAEKMRVCRYEVVAVYDNDSWTGGVVVNYERPSHDPEYWGDYEEDEICDECDEYLEDCVCDDEGEDAVMTPSQFHASFYSNIDKAWRAWSSDSSNPVLTRAEFRNAVRSGR